MSQRNRAPRLTGTQIVLIVVALCAAAVLTPVSVQAAGIAKFRLTDRNSTSAVEVSPAGRLQSDVRGSVAVTNPVSARYAVPARAFSAYWPDGQTIQQVTGSSGTVYLTSIVMSNTSASALSAWIQRYAAGCGPATSFFYYARVPANNTVTATFPTPIVINQPCASSFLVGGQVTMIVTGYRP